MKPVVRFPPGATGPRENHLWCRDVPRTTRVLAGIAWGGRVAALLPGSMVARVYDRAVGKGHYHLKGACPGPHADICNRWVARELPTQPPEA
jgi:hypothetical protein